MNNNSNGLLVILSGPSGSGKDTILTELTKRDMNIKVSTSMTTRKKREWEVDGIHYYFVDKDYFAKVVASSEIQTNRSLLSIQSYVAQKSETIAYDLTECLNTWHTDKDNLHKEMSNLINLFTT